jgi:hypothetical protein
MRMIQIPVLVLMLVLTGFGLAQKGSIEFIAAPLFAELYAEDTECPDSTMPVGMIHRCAVIPDTLTTTNRGLTNRLFAVMGYSRDEAWDLNPQGIHGASFTDYRAEHLCLVGLRPRPDRGDTWVSLLCTFY